MASLSPSTDSQLTTSRVVLSYDFSSSSAESASMYRHHRHPSNVSESSSSSPFPDHPSLEPSARLSSSPAPSFDDPAPSLFVEEPLAMEGEFATMDLQSPPSLINSYLPPSSSSSSSHQAFRYNTLTWAKEHPYLEPQDTLLLSGALHPKSSFSNLTAMLESAQQQPDHSDHSFLHTHLSSHSRSSSLHQIPSSDHLNPSASLHNSLDPSNQSVSLSESSSSHSTSTPHPSVILSNAQISTTMAPSISLNPTSPLPRLNMNHPAMPNGPSISLTSATPLTAKPDQQLEKFFESIGSLQNRSTNSLTQDSQTFAMSQSNPLFQSLGAHPPLGPTQQNPFLNPRPVRARQRSKSESMGKQHLSPHGSVSVTKLFLENPTISSPTSIKFPSTNNWTTSSSTATGSYFDSAPPSDFWSNFQTSQQANSTSPMPQFQSQSSCSNDGRNQLMQQFIDSSYLLGGLFQDVDHKKQPDLSDYDSSFLKPTAHLTHRRSHSVSHVHRRGRSEGEIATGKNENASVFDSFLPIPNLTSSSTQMNAMNSMGSQQNLVANDSSWHTSFSGDILDATYNDTTQQFTTSQVHSPVPSDVCVSSQYPSRSRSFSHGSSFGSEETGGSGPQTTSLLPLEFRSKTTAATKAAAVKRRKAGVAARYVCDMCGETFTRRYNLRGHQRAHKGEKPFVCGYPGCTSRFARAHDQKRHYKLHLGVKDYSCPVCKKTFIRLDALQRHHKSDAGQACFQRLEEARIQSSSSIDQEFVIDNNDNRTLTPNNHSDSNRGFIPDLSNEDDELRPFLSHSTHMNATPNNATTTAENLNSITAQSLGSAHS